MRIDSLNIRNFRRFEHRWFEFNPEFNLIIGVNGAGKSTLIDALAISLSHWQRGPGFGDPSDIRTINENDAFLRRPDPNVDHMDLQRQWPVEIEVEGEVVGQPGFWISELLGTSPRSERSTDGQINFKRLEWRLLNDIREGIDVNLPLFACYSTARLHEDSEVDRDNEEIYSPRLQSSYPQRFAAYRECFSASMSAKGLVDWIKQRDHDLANMEDPRAATLAKILDSAVLGCLDDANEMFFDRSLQQPVVWFGDGRAIPFSNLSDGQRIIFSMIGDIARRAVTLNPQLDELVLRETAGVVLIDELDLHLHPNWQRRIISDLRRTFPKIQFFCTTHSPFLIQTLSSNDELISLDSPTSPDPGHLGIEAIATGIMGVSDPEASPNYMSMLRAAKAYLVELDDAARAPAERLESYRESLSARLAPFASNPAFQAVLEAEAKLRLG